MGLFDSITSLIKSGTNIYGSITGTQIAKTNAQANLEAARAANTKAQAELAAINAQQSLSRNVPANQAALMAAIQASQDQINNVADNMPSPSIAGEVPVQQGGFSLSPIVVGGAILAYYALKGK